MEKIIIIKYGELTTKKDNINYFIKVLKDNIKKALINVESEITYDKGRMFIKTSSYEEVLEKLKKVFGIHEIIIGYELENTSYQNIKDNIISLVKGKKFDTFKVVSKRSDKTYPLNSMELSRKLGGELLKCMHNIKVDVHNPELTINVEVRNKCALIYFEKHRGLGGYPVGTLGKGMLMLSGGIDSPVAGYLAIKRGVKLEAVYFESPPHTSIEAKSKVFSLAKKLAIYNQDINVHVINFTEIQEVIYKNIPKEYLITIMRRMMYRITEKLAKKKKAKVIVNGESIGQVASQTLTSMSVINEVIKMPVIRPVACFDKLEIIDIAKKIDTYETSILPFEDCCTIFVPEHPVINPESEKALIYENLIPYEELINKAIRNEEVVKITDQEKKEYQDLL